MRNRSGLTLDVQNSTSTIPTSHPDEAPRRVVADQTAPRVGGIPASRILTVLADRLDSHGTLTNPISGQPDHRCINQYILALAVDDTLATVFPGIRGYGHRPAARRDIQPTLPPVTGTVTEYAAALRQTAVNL